MKYLKPAALAAALSLGLTATAEANYNEVFNETFQSGATFTGEVAFDNNFNPIAVFNAELTGYMPGMIGGGMGMTSDPLTWVYEPGFNFNSLPFSTNWLIDGAPGGYDPAMSNALLFTVDFTNPLAPVFSSGPFDNGVNTYTSYADFLVSGTITPIPEPAMVWLLLGGALSVLAVSRRRQPL